MYIYECNLVLLVYTAAEWEELKRKGGRFIRMLENEVVWMYRSSEG
jgi:hypothetical protein